MMKKNNIRKYIILVAIIVIAIIILIVISTKIINRVNGLSKNTKNIGEAVIVDDNNINIKSSNKNKIEKDGIVAEEIKLQILGNQLQVITTLKNETEEKICGYLIEIELLDKNGNVLTTISKNSDDVIEIGESIELENYVMGLSNPKEIRGAKIKSLQNKSISNFMEQSFEEMSPEEIKELENGSSSEEETPNVIGPQQSE